MLPLLKFTKPERMTLQELAIHHTPMLISAALPWASSGSARCIRLPWWRTSLGSHCNGQVKPDTFLNSEGVQEA